MAGARARGGYPQGLPQPTSLLEVLAAHAAATPDRPAIIESGHAAPASVTYGALNDAVLRTATWLRTARGVRPGDHVAVWLPNWSESLTLQFALAALGAAVVSVHTRYRAYEMANLVKIARPCGIIMPGDFLGIDFAGVLRAALESSSAPAPWVALVRPGGGAVTDADVWTLPAGPALARYPRLDQPTEDPSAVATYFATSGSTGYPKMAGHSNTAIVRHSSAIRRAFDMRPGDVFLSALPLAGVFGFNPTMAMLAGGGTCLLEPTLDVERTLADMSRFGVTHVVGGDDLLGRLMDAWHPGLDLSSLRRGGIADFAGRAGAVVEWAARTCGAAVSGVYGSSEAFALMALWPPDEPIESRRRPGGRLVSPGIELRILDVDSGQPCAPGQPGVLQVRGYNVADRFLVRAGASGPAVDPDGWLDTGDLAMATVRPDEFEYLGRQGDITRVRGFLVDLAEIERFLLTHPDVAAVKVVGARADAVTSIVAFVVTEPTRAVTSDELVAFCRAQLAAFKVPARVAILDELPRVASANGLKIAIAALREQAGALLAEG